MLHTRDRCELETPDETPRGVEDGQRWVGSEVQVRRPRKSSRIRSVGPDASNCKREQRSARTAEGNASPFSVRNGGMGRTDAGE